MKLFSVMVGGAAGAVCRIVLGNIICRKLRRDFPIATWLVKISGSALLGILTGLQHSKSIDDWLWILAGTGFCGGFTTFSTFKTIIRKK